MNDSERLIEVMKHLGFSPLGEQSKFARSINYSQDAINKVVRGRDKAEISKKMASAIVNKYQIFNKAWLLTDIGKMLIKDEVTANDMDALIKIQELKARCKRYEEMIDTLTELREIPKLDTQAIIKELEEKCEKILTGSVDRNFEQLTEELEGKILNILKNNE